CRPLSRSLQETRRIPADLPSDLVGEDSGGFCEEFSGDFAGTFTLPAIFEFADACVTGGISVQKIPP
ncbi:hypothetical protein PIB30_112018, partial [Stylosanthes scabra]|nr:hypothetical protein [Stylosanthes scabra]